MELFFVVKYGFIFYIEILFEDICYVKYFGKKFYLKKWIR